LLVHGRLFSPRTPASSTIKTDRHAIAEILLKVALNTKIYQSSYCYLFFYFLFHSGTGHNSHGSTYVVVQHVAEGKYI
jgi:hypothetical protein